MTIKKSISIATTRYKDLKFNSYIHAKRKQIEFMKAFGYKPKIFHLKNENHWLIIRPLELLKIKEELRRK